MGSWWQRLKEIERMLAAGWAGLVCYGGPVMGFTVKLGCSLVLVVSVREGRLKDFGNWVVAHVSS